MNEFQEREARLRLCSDIRDAVMRKDQARVPAGNGSPPYGGSSGEFASSAGGAGGEKRPPASGSAGGTGRAVPPAAASRAAALNAAADREAGKRAIDKIASDWRGQHGADGEGAFHTTLANAVIANEGNARQNATPTQRLKELANYMTQLARHDAEVTTERPGIPQWAVGIIPPPDSPDSQGVGTPNKDVRSTWEHNLGLVTDVFRADRTASQDAVRAAVTAVLKDKLGLTPADLADPRPARPVPPKKSLDQLRRELFAASEAAHRAARPTW